MTPQARKKPNTRGATTSLHQALRTHISRKEVKLKAKISTMSVMIESPSLVLVINDTKLLMLSCQVN
jgi:hypothetical protein